MGAHVNEERQVHRVPLLSRISGKSALLGMIAVCLFVGLARGADDEGDPKMLVYSQFDRCTRDGGLTVTPADGYARLRPVEYLTHTMGNKLSGKLSIGQGRTGKKVFVLDVVEASGAEVFVFQGKGTASFNGHPLEFGNFFHAGGWSRAPIKPEWLRAGENEIIFQSGFRLAQDAEEAPARHSFVSKDGAKSWQPAGKGEFLVQLRLDRHPPAGTVTSPVIDLVAGAGEERIRPLADVRAVRALMATETPPGTSAVLELRSGPGQRPGPDWSAWQRELGAPSRYAQWRVALGTTDRGTTPSLKEVTLEVDLDVKADPREQGLSLVELNNHRILRSSYDYTYQPPSEKLTELRERFDLRKIVEDGETELERLLLLRNWVRRQWPNNDGGSGKRTWNAMEILSAPEGQHGMCVHYAIAFAQCALSLGYVARPVVITNHFVADVWSNEHKKWVLMDVESVQKEGYDRYGTAHYVDPDTGTPLDLLQLHRAVHEARAAGEPLVDDVLQMYVMDDAEGNYRLHRKERSPQDLRIFNRFGYPMRNNHLDQLEPWEEYHGMDYYHSNIFRWWWGTSPAARENQFVRHTNRVGDLFWTVNLAEMALNATEEPGVLAVSLETVTPNFDGFLYRINGAEWRTEMGTGDDPDERTARLRWKLRPGGENTFEVKTRNKFGIEGAVSSATVEFKPEG